MLKEELENRKIAISLRVFEPSDLATGWEVKAIVENPDIFEDFYSKYPLNQVTSMDDYYLYLLSLKLQSLSNVIPILIHEDHKTRIAVLSDAAKQAVQGVNPGNIIKFINDHIEEIFNIQICKHDIRFVTLDLVAKYNTGINSAVFSYLCKHYGFLLIDRFEDFENVFEREPELFKSLFPDGKLEAINPYRFEKVLDIWQHIVNKGRSNLKNLIISDLPTLFNDIVSLAISATIDNVMQIEGTIREFNLFLQKIKSPMANEFAPYAKDIENLLTKYINERGQSFQFEIPVDEIIKRWKAIENWELRLLNITHELIIADGHDSFMSRLAKKPEPKTSLVDLVSTNIPTDEYYTMSHQQTLSIHSSVGTATILGILRAQETLRDFICLIISAVQFISEQLHADGEGLKEDVEVLLSMVQLVVDNHNADNRIVHSLCYSASMYICAFSEKLLRLFYVELIKDRLYVPVNKATLGELLNEGNNDILEIFGEHHIKSLSFFLMQTPHKNIGHNIRNNLAHWSNLSVSVLKPTLVAQMLWLFTDILNTIFGYFLKDATEGD